MRKLDRHVADRSGAIVATSPKFLDVFYKEWIKTKTPGLLIENKLEAAFCEKMERELASAYPLEGVPFQDRPLRIGYYGYLRNEWSLKVLEKLATKFPERFEVNIAGYPKESAKNILSRISLATSLYEATTGVICGQGRTVFTKDVCFGSHFFLGPVAWMRLSLRSETSARLFTMRR